VNPSKQPGTVVGELQGDAPSRAVGGGNRELSGKLAGLTLHQQVAVLAVWPLCEHLLNFSVGFVDTWCAGHLSVDASDALGVTVYVSWLLRIVQMAVATGATAIVARAIGGRHRRLANAAVGQSLLMAAVGGAMAGAAVFFLAPFIADYTGLTGTAHQMAISYMRIDAFSAPLTGLLMTGTACQRGAGDTRTPFFVMMLVNLVNAFMTWLLVFGPKPFGGHGTNGIASGTLIAWSVGTCVILVALLRGWGGLRLHAHRMRPHPHTIKRLFMLAVPSFFESVGQWSANFFVIHIVGKLAQPGAMGAHNIAIRIEAISYMPGMAMGVAAATLMGQYLGLGDERRAKQAVKICWSWCTLIMGVMGLLFILIPGKFVGLLTDEPELLRLAPPLIRICGVIEVFFATAIVCSLAMRGAGATKEAMLITLASSFLLRIPGAYILGVHYELGLSGIWYAMCAELAIRGIVFGIVYLRGSWSAVKV